MKKIILLILLLPFFCISQVQIGQDIDGEAPGDLSGMAVSLSSNGTIVAIGAGRNDDNGTDSGHVRVYENQSGIWTQLGQDIDGEAIDDQSGVSVSLSADGTIVAISDFLNDDNGDASGQVRVFENIGGTWTQIGQDINGEGEGDWSGFPLSLSSDGNIVAIGARFNDGSNGMFSGHVRVYENIGGTWLQIGNDIDGEAEFDGAGQSVSLSSDGTIVAVGATGNDGNGSNSGHVRIFENIGGTWTQIGNDIEGETAINQLGLSVSLSGDGNIVAIGANGDGGNGPNSGLVHIFQNQLGDWVQIGNSIGGEAEDDSSGLSISLSEDAAVIAIGAPGNDGNGAFSGHVRVYDTSAVLSTTDNTISKFRLYPNPATNQLTIKLSNRLELENIIIYNSLGQFVSSTTQKIIDTSNFSSGTYFVEVITNEGKTTNKLILK